MPSLPLCLYQGKRLVKYLSHLEWCIVAVNSIILAFYRMCDKGEGTGEKQRGWGEGGNGNLLQHLRYLTFVLRRYSQAAQQIPTPSSALVPGRRGTQKTKQKQKKEEKEENEGDEEEELRKATCTHTHTHTQTHTLPQLMLGSCITSS